MQTASINVDEMLKTPFTLPALAALRINIIYIIEGELSVQEADSKQSHHLTAGDAIIVTSFAKDTH
jgi:hypothetical protein